MTKLYTLDNQFISTVDISNIPDDFTGIVLYSNGTKSWWKNGKYHRLDGPACEYPTGTKEWFFEDKLHRLDGPAIENENGTKEWYVYDKQVSEEQHNLLSDTIKLKGLL